MTVEVEMLGRGFVEIVVLVVAVVVAPGVSDRMAAV